MTDTGTFPVKISRSEFKIFRVANHEWIKIAKNICCFHQIKGESVVPIKRGSNLVAAVGNRLMIKIFPPFLNSQWESERLALQQLRGKIVTQTPELLFQGKKDGWPYLIFTRLEGISLEEVWVIASEDERNSILFQIGQLIQRVHQVPVGRLTQLEPKWDKFVLEQKQSCRIRHEKLNLQKNFVLEIEQYIQKVEPYLPENFSPSILTGEYTPENLLLQKSKLNWTIRGLIDFGDVMIGPAEYDLLGPSIFLCAGKRDRIRSLFFGRGYKEQVLIMS